MIEDTFVKQHGSNVVEDWQRAEHLYEALRSTPFRAPKPLFLNNSAETISYEFLPEGQMLTAVLNSEIMMFRKERSEVARTMLRVGEALAEIHANMKPISDDVLNIDFSSINGVRRDLVVAAQLIVETSETVATHGDYSHCNIWLTSDQKIWVIDPIPATFLPKTRIGMSSIYLDLGSMVSCIWAAFVPWRHTFAKWDRAKTWIAAFLEGYSLVSNEAIDKLALAMSALYITEKYVDELESTQSRRHNLLWLPLKKRRSNVLLKNINEGRFL